MIRYRLKHAGQTVVASFRTHQEGFMAHSATKTTKALSEVKASEISIAAFHSPIGWCALAGRENWLAALTIGHRNAEAALRFLQSDPRWQNGQSPVKTARWNPSLVDRIVAMLEGEPDDFRDVEVDLDHLAPFSRRVAQYCRKIGWGTTTSYAELAELAGSPGAARAVGQVMAGNRTPLVIPCHRVVGSGGRLCGFSAPQGLSLKRWLLEMEQGKAGVSASPSLPQGRIYRAKAGKISKILA
jgi:methylated-DNA-[protein]-cysteine S-methyltransferase